jgi:hypothetical protein
MSRVLVVSNDTVGTVMAGPGIRYYHFAKELAKTHDVALLTPNEPDLEVPGVRLVRATDYSNVRRLARDFDTLVTQRMSVVAMTYLAGTDLRVIYDLYDPFMIESLPSSARATGNAISGSARSAPSAESTSRHTSATPR